MGSDGGGGGDDARQMEAERQARIQAATDEINRVFNNQVRQTGLRYVSGGQALTPEQYAEKPNQAKQTGLRYVGSGQVLTPEQYAEKQAAYSQALARNASMFSNGRSPFGMVYESNGDSQIARPKTAEEFTAEQLGFTPDTFSAQNYDYWVDGDPANSRDRLYENQRSAVYDLNKTEVDRQATEAERFNRFGLARSGLLGGSVNVDSVADLDRRTNEGLMRAGGIADQASADLKTADERTRSNLISLAQSGIDTGTAAQQALKGLEVNAANASSARAGSTVGGLFNDLSQAYLMNQVNQGRQSGGAQYGSQWSGVSSPSTTYQGNLGG